MSIEIDVLNGEQSWTLAEPLMKAVWPQEVLDKLPWGHIQFAQADLRVLIEQPEGGLACHVGIYFRTVIWNGRKFHIGGIGGLATRADSRGQGYASIALNAAVQTMRDHEAVQFALLFCESHNFAFYGSRGWHPTLLEDVPVPRPTLEATPDLERHGWRHRTPLAEVVHEERFGRPALR